MCCFIIAIDGFAATMIIRNDWRELAKMKKQASISVIAKEHT